MPEISPGFETPLERKRRRDREYIAAKRASLTPEQRAERRRAYDERYRDVHRDQRRAYDRGRASTRRAS